MLAAVKTVSIPSTPSCRQPSSHVEHLQGNRLKRSDRQRVPTGSSSLASGPWLFALSLHCHSLVVEEVTPNVVHDPLEMAIRWPFQVVVDALVVPSILRTILVNCPFLSMSMSSRSSTGLRSRTL